MNELWVGRCAKKSLYRESIEGGVSDARACVPMSLRKGEMCHDSTGETSWVRQKYRCHINGEQLHL